MAYLGLSQQEFDDIHESVAEAMAYVALPVTFYVANPTEVDDLYREASDGDDAWTPFATINASVRFKPDEELLTRFGLQPNADVLLFIPRKHILDWEAATGQTFEVRRSMEFEWEGLRFEVKEDPRTDPLPVGDGSSSDYIGMVVCGHLARP